MKRIYMTDGYRQRLADGSVRRFQMGEFYLLDDEDADEIIGAEAAYDEEDPPTCEICGQTFEGADAYLLRKNHRLEEHPADQIDDLTKDQLRERLLDHDVNPDEIEGTGADGNVLKEDLQDALVAAIEEE